MAVPHLHRAFGLAADVDLTGRTLSARFVPYGVVADVVDVFDGQAVRYREGFDPGAFAVQATSREPGVARRIAMRHLHGRGEGLGYLGSVSALHEQPDGLHGDVLLSPSRVDDVADLLAQGVDGVSVEFHSPAGGTQTRDGVQWRTRAVLHAVSLEPQAAYVGAKVLSMREATEVAELDTWLAEERARQAELEQRFAKLSTPARSAPVKLIGPRPTAGEHDATYMHGQDAAR